MLLRCVASTMTNCVMIVIEDNEGCIIPRDVRLIADGG